MNAPDHVEGDDEMDGSAKKKNYIINYNRFEKIDKQNENEKRTNDLQIFPPIDVNGPSEINDDLKQEFAATKANTEYVTH